ncbi:MAG: hypothetical protein PHS92_04945 [Candidatus Gracilibacteria bacterium]|nr:hypothetical protein [Candidatus Gracilibacteria bacterium]
MKKIRIIFIFSLILFNGTLSFASTSTNSLPSSSTTRLRASENITIAKENQTIYAEQQKTAEQNAIEQQKFIDEHKSEFSETDLKEEQALLNSYKNDIETYSNKAIVSGIEASQNERIANGESVNEVYGSESIPQVTPAAESKTAPAADSRDTDSSVEGNALAGDAPAADSRDTDSSVEGNALAGDAPAADSRDTDSSVEGNALAGEETSMIGDAWDSVASTASEAWDNVTKLFESEEESEDPAAVAAAPVSTPTYLGVNSDKLRKGDIGFDDLPKVINSLTTWLLGIAATVAMIMIIIGAYKIALGSLNNQVQKGKEAITMGIIGLTVSVSAWFIINTIISNL